MNATEKPRRGGSRPRYARPLDPADRALLHAVVTEIVRAERLTAPGSRADVRRRLKPYVDRALTDGRSIVLGFAEAVDCGAVRLS